MRELRIPERVFDLPAGAIAAGVSPGRKEDEGEVRESSIPSWRNSGPPSGGLKCVQQIQQEEHEHQYNCSDHDQEKGT